MEYMQVNRANGRAVNELRPVKLTRGVMKHAHGSCLAEFGDTRVLCAATIEEGVPGWRKGAKAGWVTAEYARCYRPRPVNAASASMPTARAAPWRSSGLSAAACVPSSI